MAQQNAIDLIAEEVTQRLRGEFRQHVEGLVTAAKQDADAILADFAARLERVDVSPEAPKSDAKDRAWRTLLQGLLATILLAGTGAVADALTSESFDITHVGDWKFAITGAATAVTTAALSYVMRFIQPPRS
mgnify:CR=1 FL=1